MIFGMISVIFYLLFVGVTIAKFNKEGRNHKFFLYIDKPLAGALVVISLVHLIMTLSLIHQRPLIIYILGLIIMLSMLASIGVYFFRRKMKSVMLFYKRLVLITLISIVLHISYNIKYLREYQSNVSAISLTDIDLSTISDGCYIGEYDVEYIFAKVEVYVSKGKIIDIRIIEHRNEHGEKGEGVIDRILDQQRLDVDAISGATNSSKVIKKAVENALRKNNQDEAE